MPAIDGTEHCLMLCHSYLEPRPDLLKSVNATLLLRSHSSPSNQDLGQIILYGDERLPMSHNKKLDEATMNLCMLTIQMNP